MSAPGDVREIGPDLYEMLHTIEVPGGEYWIPLATFIVSQRFVEFGGNDVLPVRLFDALVAEGWTPPQNMETEA